MSEGRRTVRYPRPPPPGSRLTERSGCLWRPLAAEHRPDGHMGSTSRPPPSMTAINNHMLDDEPPLFFIHFQRRSPAARQGAARGARSSEGAEGVIARPRRQLRL